MPRKNSSRMAEAIRDEFKFKCQREGRYSWGGGLFEVGGVAFHELGFGIAFRKDGFLRAFIDADAAVDAGAGIDEELGDRVEALILARVDGVGRTDGETEAIFGTFVSNYVRHKPTTFRETGKKDHPTRNLCVKPETRGGIAG